MGQQRRMRQLSGRPSQPTPAGTRRVSSLLDVMQDDNEYGSIVSLVPENADLIPEFRRALADLQRVRGRPCVMYVANIIKDVQDTGIQGADHLPFCEMVGRVDPGARMLDIFVATPGGSAEQVNLFVEALRPRFDQVDFLVPYKAMSAGTLWALACDNIWMDTRAFLGPLDPQVPSKDGRFVPAQALLTLAKLIQEEGARELAQGRNPPWSLIRLLDQMDQRQLGSAITSTDYVVNMATEYLSKFKFRSWTHHSTTQLPVTTPERDERASWVAGQLASHDKWKAHGHAISRDVLWQALKVRIDHPETVDGLQRAIRRLWALTYYMFDRSAVVKMLLSDSYAFVRQQVTTQVNMVVAR